MTDETRLATSAIVQPTRLQIDGEPFPFYIAEHGVRIKPGMRGDISVVTVLPGKTYPLDEADE